MLLKEHELFYSFNVFQTYTYLIKVTNYDS